MCVSVFVCVHTWKLLASAWDLTTVVRCGGVGDSDGDGDGDGNGDGNVVLDAVVVCVCVYVWVVLSLMG